MQQRPNPAGRRPMSRVEYERLRRQRQRQNLLALAVIVAIAAAVVVAVVLVLRPGAPGRDVSVSTDVDADQTAGPTPEPTEEPEPVDETVVRSVRMRVVGDIMACLRQLEFAAASNYSFDNQFELIADLLQDADYTMGNLETTIGKYRNMNYSGFPQFNAPEQLLETLKKDGFDFLTLANNHMLDRWFDGMKNTVDNVEKYGFDHVGAYRSQTERDAATIYEIGGIRFGFVAYTHSTNTMENSCDPDAIAYGVPYLYKADIAGDIRRLREAGAQVVIAFPHWGEEYVRTPDRNQKRFAVRLAEAGADIIIGSHSHMVQPMGYQTVAGEGGAERKVFTMFSMGNFISDHERQYTDAGVILDFTVNEHDDGSFTCDRVRYIPTYTWVQDGAIRVLPSGRYLETRPEGMSDAAFERMVESYGEIVDMLGKDFKVIKG